MILPRVELHAAFVAARDREGQTSRQEMANQIRYSA